MNASVLCDATLKRRFRNNIVKRYWLGSNPLWCLKMAILDESSACYLFRIRGCVCTVQSTLYPEFVSVNVANIANEYANILIVFYPSKQEQRKLSNDTFS